MANSYKSTFRLVWYQDSEIQFKLTIHIIDIMFSKSGGMIQHVFKFWQNIWNFSDYHGQCRCTPIGSAQWTKIKNSVWKLLGKSKTFFCILFLQKMFKKLMFWGFQKNLFHQKFTWTLALFLKFLLLTCIFSKKLWLGVYYWKRLKNAYFGARKWMVIQMGLLILVQCAWM